LTVPIIQGKEIVERKQLPPDPDREAKLIKMRDSMGQFRPLRLSPLERGWSGTKMHGRSLGPPDPIGQGNNNIIKLTNFFMGCLVCITVFSIRSTFQTCLRDSIPEC